MAMTYQVPSGCDLMKFYSQRILGCSNPCHCLAGKSYHNLNLTGLYLKAFLAETLKIIFSTPGRRTVLEANTVTSLQRSIACSPAHTAENFLAIHQFHLKPSGRILFF